MKIETLSLVELERLRPLWLQLHAHHQQVAPALQPFVDPATSWSARRAQYVHAIESGGFILLACAEDRPLGYLVAAREPLPWPDFFADAAPVMELVTLSVDPAWRGGGIGSQLLDRFDAVAGDCFVGVIPANTRAIGLYRRRGFRPVSLLLLRFARQMRGGAAGSIAAVERSEIDALQRLFLSWHEQYAPALGASLSADAAWRRVKAGLEQAAAAGRLFRAGPADRPLGLMRLALADASGFADTWVTNGPQVAEISFWLDDGAGIARSLLSFAERHLAAQGVTDLMVNALALDDVVIEASRELGFEPGWLQMKRFG